MYSYEEQDTIRDIRSMIESIARLEPRQYELVRAAVQCLHRTHQQSFMRVVVDMIHAWANDERNKNFDDRNADTVKLARFISEQIQDKDGLSYI